MKPQILSESFITVGGRGQAVSNKVVRRTLRHPGNKATYHHCVFSIFFIFHVSILYSYITHVNALYIDKCCSCVCLDIISNIIMFFKKGILQ